MWWCSPSGRLYKVFQRRKTMQGHDIQITTTELNHSSSGFQFPLCFHSVLIWTLSFHSDCLLKFYESLQLSCFANVTEVHHWNNHTNLWMLLIESFFNSIAGKHQSQSNYGFLLLRFVAEMCKSLKYPPTIWNTKAPCITIVARLICTLGSDLKGTL